MGGNSVSKVADEQSFATVVPEGMAYEASNHNDTAKMPQKVGAVENGTHEERSALSHGNDDNKVSVDNKSELKAHLSASDIVDGIDDEYKEGAKGLLEGILMWNKIFDFRFLCSIPATDDKHIPII